MKRQRTKIRALFTNSIFKFTGYAGYITGVKSENLYGQTYGKTTYKSSAGTFERGIDQTPDVKYTTTMKNEQNIFPTDDPQENALKFETTAQIVGVNRGAEKY